jgi:hypothetical protein
MEYGTVPVFNFPYVYCLAHEELAQLTEAERLALQNSNDFFEFGEDDEGDALEPEPQVPQITLLNTEDYLIRMNLKAFLFVKCVDLK